MSCIRPYRSRTPQSISCRPLRRHPTSFSFLHLPGEIRNQIYDLLFAGHVHIYHNHPVKERLENNNVKSRFRLESRCIYSLPAGTHFYVRPTLLRACRQIHDEAAPFLYANTTFRLHSVLTVNKFLNVAPAVGVVKKLELWHSTYGEPRLTEDRKWKHRHDKAWMRTCRRIAAEMTALADLKLDLRICDWPTQLNLAAAWAKPLLELKGTKGIDRVEVTLIHNAFNQNRLQATSNVVARAMMSEEGRRRRQLAGDRTRPEKLKIQRVRLRHNARTVMEVVPVTTAAHSAGAKN